MAPALLSIRNELRILRKLLPSLVNNISRISAASYAPVCLRITHIQNLKYFSVFEKNRMGQGIIEDRNIVKRRMKISPYLLVHLSETLEEKVNVSNDPSKIVNKPFSYWTFDDVRMQILKDDCSSIRGLPTFEIDEIGKEKMGLTPKEFKDFKEEISRHQKTFSITVDSSKPSRWPLLVAYFSAVMRLMEEKNIQVQCEVEMDLAGSCANGSVDYVFVQNNIILLTATRAKKKKYEKDLVRAIAEMHIASEERQKRGVLGTNSQVIMYGLVTDGFCWTFLKYIRKSGEKKAEVKIMEGIVTPADLTKDDDSFHRILDIFLRILAVQTEACYASAKAKIYSGISERKN